jgi:hypothetical protein
MESRARRWRWVAPAAAILAIAGDSACRRVGQQARHSDDASYAAEAGLEFAKDELARVCRSPQALADLRRAAGASFVALPGLEEPIAKIYGYDLPGGATVSVTLRVREAAPSEFVLRALGRSPTEEKTAVGSASCELVQKRKRSL